MTKRMLAAGFVVVLFGILAAIGPSQLRAQRPPKGPLAPAQQLNVNCGAGQTIGDALAQAQDMLGHVQINILGVCREVVQISRSDVTLMGVSREDGIEAPESIEFTVSINGPNLVRLANLTVTGGSLGAFGGASFEADDITIQDAINGIGADKGVFGILRNVTIQNMSGFGANVGSGGHLTLIGSQVHDNAYGVYAAEGATFRVEASTIEYNSQFGAGASDGGVLSIQNTVIQNNPRFGLYVGTNGAASVSNGSVIKNNAQGGAVLNIGAVLNLRSSTIELNTGSGIVAQDGSIVSLGDSDAIVQNNTGSGVFLGHASAVTGNGQIKNNGAYGVQCTDPSAWIGGFGALQIGPNTSGATKDCQFGT